MQYCSRWVPFGRETYLLVNVRQCWAVHGRKETGAGDTSLGFRKRTNWRMNGCKVVGIGSSRQRRKCSGRVYVTADASGEKYLRAKESEFVRVHDIYLLDIPLVVHCSVFCDNSMFRTLVVLFWSTKVQYLFMRSSWLRF